MPDGKALEEYEWFISQPLGEEKCADESDFTLGTIIGAYVWEFGGSDLEKQANEIRDGLIAVLDAYGRRVGRIY